MCPGREVLSSLACDNLAENERAAVLAHVSQCGHCRELLAVIAPDEGPPTKALLLKPKKAA
jgi:hypothetical protein